MAKSTAFTAFNPYAPADERYDARADLDRTFRPLASQLHPPDAVREVIDFIQGQMADHDLLKANNILTFPGQRVIQPKPRGMQSVYLDGQQIMVQGDYFDKPGALNFEAMRQMVEATPILNAVVMTRIRQVTRFCQPSEDGGLGFEIRHQDRKHKLKPTEQESVNLLARFFKNCGWEFNPRARKRLKRDSMTQFMAKSVRDTLCMDAAPIETEMKRDRSLGIDGMYAVDGTTVRLCMEDGYHDDDEIFALQVIQGRITAAYTHDQLIYEVRNPRSDVRVGGYGMGETELLIRTVTGFLNAMTYNINGFDNNKIPKGLLHISGDYSAQDLAAFKRAWNAQVKGIENAWALPVMVSKDGESKASFENFGIEFDEMAFARWMTFLTSIVCAIYGMSPEEINSESFSAGKSSLSGSDTEQKLADSKDKGLRPLLSFYEAMFTDYVVSSFSDDLCFRWVGLDEEDADQLFEKQKLILSVDELRAETGYEPHPNPLIGGAPLNPSLVSIYQQDVQPPPEQPGAAFGGPPGEPEKDYGNPGDQDEQGGYGAEGPEQAAPDQTGQGAPAGDFGSGGSSPPGGDAGDFTKAFPDIWAIGE